MMRDVGFWEAVGLWWAGGKFEEITMYGLEMKWWARIGKYLQFLGGAAVVLDLVGPARLRQLKERSQLFSNALNKIEKFIHKRVDRLSSDLNPDDLYRDSAWGKFRAETRAAEKSDQRDRPSSSWGDRLSSSWRDRLNTLVKLWAGFVVLIVLTIGFLVTDVTLAEFVGNAFQPVSDLRSVVQNIRAVAVLALAVVVLPVSIVWSVMVLVYLLIRSLSGENPGHPLRWLAFILIVIGFHLDLLGS
ncbi:hypothetical protein ACH347_40090 [Saccharopolyspora sp. 5N102]|uniref:hypothetical protein n=1 Tax=Saccharopolyspora sp. 5N102 TaxID=3375155 RepID=UPI00378E2116